MSAKVSVKIQSNTAHIEALLRKATLDEVRSGRCWYMDAHNDCEKALEEIGSPCTLSEFINVVALLSPRMRWDSNIEGAQRLVSTWVRGGSIDEVKIQSFKANRQKAWDCLSDWQFQMPGAAGETKVASFAHCIKYHEDTELVCIDGHAIGAWMGIRADSITANGKAYQVIQEDYQSVANKWGYLPHQVQAICWLTYRRIHNIK